MSIRTTLLALSVTLSAAGASVATAEPPNGSGLAYPPGTPNAATSTIASEFWRPILERPIDDPGNPWNTGGCVVSGDVAIDYGFADCRVPAGTRIYESGYSVECSTAEPTPFFADSEQAAIACGRANVAGLTRLDLTVDGRTVDLLDDQYELLLPWRSAVFADPSVFGEPGPAMFGGVSRAATLRPLSVGTHHVTISVAGTLLDVPEPIDDEFSWDIVVTPRR